MEKCGVDANRTLYNLPRRTAGQKLLLLNLLKKKNAGLSKGKVLVIDEEDIIRTRLCLMLASCGYEPTLAEPGSAAGAYRNKKESGKPFDAVIIDLHSPNAPKVLKRLLDIDPEARIIASGHDFEAADLAGGSPSFKGMLAKPYRIDHLKAVLQYVIVGTDY